MELIRIPKVENVKLVDRLNYANPDKGTLYLTPTHVIFVDPVTKKEYWILLMHVSSVEKLPITTSGCPLFIKCKHFLQITFVIPRESDALDVYLSLNQLSQPTKITDLYCFYYNTQNETFDKKDGWSNFDICTEYSRFMDASQHWYLSDVNNNYAICDTYPSQLHVPLSATKECLIESAKFRSKGRLPVLSYLYTNQAAICRCSQPLSGFNNRSIQDEDLLDKITKANPSGKELYIVDTRPKINAMANRAAGKGYESEQYYSSAKFHFFAIENIHVMRASLNKLLEACDIKISNSNFLTNIGSSNWLKHVKSLLDTSDFIANSIMACNSVLVHCSDGWDRTAQACSLSSLQLDPYYRTILGFQALIFKEWLSFGHKFSDRCGHILSDTRETAPVFTQFLDAVWQILCQAPTEFEFNEEFLIAIHDHIYSCQFGTFIGNCERERKELNLSELTYSFWAYLDSHHDEYINPFYNPTIGPGQQKNMQDGNQTYPLRCAENFLKIDTSAQRIKFWRGLYNRHELLVHPRETASDLLIEEKDAIQILENLLHASPN